MDERRDRAAREEKGPLTDETRPTDYTFGAVCGSLPLADSARLFIAERSAYHAVLMLQHAARLLETTARRGALHATAGEEGQG
jgi:hypothetical protein